ncbi:hypothetical protein GCM10010191_40990 [Actinomadura vinacea]|uniref:Uncharacterized protein n=1 Tax=Actinomadura vinacea TaxID=115336 RepID=A0ABN3J8K8_9ACTN
MASRTPQEKKRLSYLKDRRNLYGENDKASRKNLPRRRQRKHRAERHRVHQTLGQARGVPDEAREDAIEQRLKGRRLSSSSWRKSPDFPLGETVEYRLRRRVERGNADASQAESRIRRIQRRLS